MSSMTMFLLGRWPDKCGACRISVGQKEQKYETTGNWLSTA